MLTNVYYYNFYQPYIMKKGNKPSANQRGLEANSLTKTAGKADYRTDGELTAIKLEKNNSARRDVIRYARNIFKNVTDIKDSSKYLRYDAENFYLNALEEGFDKAKEWAKEDLAAFTESYNDTAYFLADQTNSGRLNAYGEEIVQAALSNRQALDEIGVNLSDDGRVMSLNAGKAEGFDYLDFGAALSGIKGLAGEVYEKTKELLSQPLSEHLNFRQFNYYYNYRITAAAAPVIRGGAFALIESGLLVDKII